MVIDAGIVEPDGARAQAEGGALWGLSMALHDGTEFDEGQVKRSPFFAWVGARPTS